MSLDFKFWLSHVKEGEITYLGCPYSHSSHHIMQHRFEKICRISSVLMHDGHILFVPIVMCHPISRDYGLPGDFKFWWQLDIAFIKVCQRMLIVKMNGWEKSKGLYEEQVLANKYKLPVYFMETNDV